MDNKRLLQIFFGILVLMAISAFFYFDLHVYLTKENIQAVRSYLLGYGWWTPFIIILLYIVFNITGLPTLYFSTLCGYLYGMTEGFFLAWIGMTIGLFASFIWGRFLFRAYFVKQYGHKKIIKRLEALLQRYHLWAVVFTRSSFIFPYNILNYAYSITAIKTSTYLIGSAIGIIIPTIIMVYTGSLLP